MVYEANVPWFVVDAGAGGTPILNRSAVVVVAAAAVCVYVCMRVRACVRGGGVWGGKCSHLQFPSAEEGREGESRTLVEEKLRRNVGVDTDVYASVAC